MPVAKTCRPLPSGSNASTSARFSSLSHAAPSACDCRARRRGRRADRPACRRRRWSRSRPTRTCACRRPRRRCRASSGRRSTGRSRDQRLGGPARLQIAVAVGKAQHRIGVADIDELRIGSGRIEGDAERRVETRGEDRHYARLGAVAAGAQHADAARLALGDENVAVGRDADEARLFQLVGEQRDRDARRRFGTAPAGRGTMRGRLKADGSRRGGRSLADSRCTLPGASSCQSPCAACAPGARMQSAAAPATMPRINSALRQSACRGRRRCRAPSAPPDSPGYRGWRSPSRCSRYSMITTRCLMPFS